jgi:hypothetical protein
LGRIKTLGGVPTQWKDTLVEKNRKLIGDYHPYMIYKFDPHERGSDANYTDSPWFGRTEHFSSITKPLPATNMLKGCICKLRQRK